MKTGKAIRQDFISFFEEKGHRFVRSSPVVPIDDPTLLFTNAGMNQFKPIFLDLEKPRYKRVVNSQKCIRVSGKHNDLEEVGIDNYHHTFFEMLGNWSFGDYYKAEAIQWAWELFTDVWGMDPNRLWATVHHTDDEAADLWPKMTDIPPERVLRFGDKDNFWEMGETGPCGPCSEIHYYEGADLSRMSAAGVNVEPEYKELWNLVFIQNNRLEDGSLKDLPAKHVDTGAGLERIVAVLQGKTSNYDTDLFTPIIEHITKITGVPSSEGDGVAHRVLADHVRMLAFSMADGALPSNEGRGYVVRRILRRAARFGRMLERHDPFIYELVDTVTDVMGAAFPEIVEKREHIERVIEAEEASFGETLDRGLEIFARLARDLSSGDVIPGEEAFRLYDTYGFPLDLTELMAREKGLAVDTKGFEKAMGRQRERARGAKKSDVKLEGQEWVTLTEGESSHFLGYATIESEATIRKYRIYEADKLDLILDQTPFYAESGGQIGDTGTITTPGLDLKVVDTQKSAVQGDEEIIHFCEILRGKLDSETKVTAAVDADRRQAIRLNHTATHLLHKALKMVLGDHVQQAGSLVAPDRLRFDFTHYQKVSEKGIKEIEKIVNQVVHEDISLDASVQDFDDARKGGAVAIFGEKYGDRVRVVEVPGFSKELCGGTHVDRTGDIGYFKITSETAVAAGVRRMEAVTGNNVLIYYDQEISSKQAELKRIAASNEELASHLSSELSEVSTMAVSAELQRALDPDSFTLGNVENLEKHLGDLTTATEQLQKEHKVLLRELKKQRKRVSSKELFDDLTLTEIATIRIGFAILDVHDQDEFKDLAVEFKHRLKSGVVVLGTLSEDRPQVVVAVTDDLKAKLPAGELARELGQRLGGGGGGTPILGTAGGRDPSLLQKVLSETPAVVQHRLERQNG
ncbi:MAG: alanine--tRNA ligase [Fidelibacterota bacterium]|nr:MAG: alanine--tRNA ligase [Candidatus Neomarinimicrobiota bacterium]